MLTPEVVRDVVARALAEDSPWGDLTADALLPPGARVEARLVAREAGVLAGIDVFAAAMTHLGDVTVTPRAADGDRFGAGSVLADVEGPAAPVLRAERVALNLLQRTCGTATLTAAFVEAVAGTRARIVDTRKTTPGLRALERHAVRCGGGRNHRSGLSDAVMAKDNHLAVLAAAGVRVGDAVRAARGRLSHTTHLEVEVDRLDQLAEVVDAGADSVLLDNFSLPDLRAGVALVAGRAVVEASGGITLATVADVAATGVDVISVGALTHAARALDLGLDVDA